MDKNNDGYINANDLKIIFASATKGCSRLKKLPHPSEYTLGIIISRAMRAKSSTLNENNEISVNDLRVSF
jgi:hypothetical protein